MKKRFLLMGFAGLLAITTVIGGTMAAFQIKTEKPGVSELTTGVLRIGIYDDREEEVGNQEEYSSAKLLMESDMECIMPGAVIMDETSNDFKLPLRIKNEDESGYDAYIRVRINKTWMDDLEKGKNSENMKVASFNQIQLKHPSSNVGSEIIFSGWNDDWIEIAGKDMVTLYYKKKLSPGKYTNFFLKKIKFNENMNNSFADKNVYFHIEADAVQALKDNQINRAAILSTWNMDATLTNQNEIDSLK